MSSEVVSSQILRDVQQYLRVKIFSQGLKLCRRLPNHLSHPKDKLLNILQRVILYGDSTSVLVLGPRNSGKSLIVNRAIADLKADSKTADCFIDIYLNGAVQNKDVAALKEVATQLSLATELEESSVVSNKLSSADTFSFLLETLKSGTKESKAVIFVLDEFDRFAAKQSQKLLYSLLEQTQHANTPVVIVGSTCRLDVMDLLEKRIKSRLSRQQINLFTGFSFQEYIDMFRDLLELDDDFAHTEFAVEWNKSVKVLLENREVIHILQNQYDLTRDLGSFQQLLAVPIGKIAVGHQFIEVSDLQDSAVRMSLDTTKSDINGLSVLELCLLIAMTHLTEKSYGKPFNCEMVYQECRKFATKSRSVDFLTKPVALQAIQRLMTLELVLPADSQGTSRRREFCNIRLAIAAEQVEDAIKDFPNCPTDVLRWAKSPVLS